MLCLYSYSGIAQIPGSRYCGPYTSSEAVIMDGRSNITISGLEINTTRDNAIQLSNCNNVRIENCKITAAVLSGIELKNCRNVSITNCKITNVATGVVAYSSQEVSVTYIEVKNVQGPFPRGQMVQFHQVSGGGNRINYNVSENFLGQSYAEDAINLYKSRGTPSDPIQVIGNWIRGGGPSKSGGGIMTGDLGGGNVIVKDNILVDPGQYGVAIAGGTNITLENNTVYARQQSFTNVGLYVWNINAPNCGDHTVKNNRINWKNNGGQGNHMWNGNNCGSITGWNTNILGANIDASILPEQILDLCNESQEDNSQDTNDDSNQGSTQEESNMDKSNLENVNIEEAEAVFPEQVIVYPNPAHNTIFIERQNKDSDSDNSLKTVRVNLYDFTGRQVKSILVNKVKNKVQISGLSEGLYLYTVEIDDVFLPSGKLYIIE